MIVDTMRKSGEGDLHEQYKKLFDKLEKKDYSHRNTSVRFRFCLAESRINFRFRTCDIRYCKYNPQT